MRRSQWLVVVVCGAVLLASVASRAGAREGSGATPLSRDDLDKRVHTTLYQILMDGRDLYYADKPNSAFYLLQGAAMALEPLLDHRPPLQKALRADLAAAQAQTGPERAKTLYLALLKIHQQTEEPSLPAPVASQTAGKTLWERLGGEEGVKRLIDDVVKGCLDNEKANFTRGGKYLKTEEEKAALKRQLVLLTSALGKGPHKWKGPTMKDVHKDMHITDSEYDAVRTEVYLALNHHRVAPDDIRHIIAAVDAIRSDIVTEGGSKVPSPTQLVVPKPDGPGQPPPPWPGIAKEKMQEMVNDLIDRLVKDERVNLSRNGRFPMTDERIRHLKKQFLDLALATGKGGAAYKGKTMIEAHKGMGITDSEFDAFLDDLDRVLRDNVGPADVFFIKQLVESKRADIVEKPGKASNPAPGATPKPEIPGQGKAPERTAPAPAANRQADGGNAFSGLWTILRAVGGW